MRHRIRITATALLGLGLALSGCATDDHQPTPVEASPTESSESPGSPASPE